MKRFIPLFLAVVLVVACMIIPAAAAETEDVIYRSSDMNGTFEHGGLPLYFRFSLYDASGNCVFSSEPVTLADGCSIESGFNYTGGLLGPVTYIGYRFTHYSDDSSYCNVVDYNFEFCSDEECLFLEDWGYSLQLEVLRASADSPSVPDKGEDKPVLGAGSLIGSIIAVFSSISSWITGQIGSVSGLFWNASSGALTFLGVLSIVGIAIACALMLINVCRSFLRFG